MAAHTLVHVSDLHLLGDGLLFDAVDCAENVRLFAARVLASGIRPDAIVVTGDVADRAEPLAYERARETLDPLAAGLGCALVWVMGNHDHRGTFAERLLDGGATNQAITVGGLRIVALDSTVPGYHYGRLDEATLDWLREVLASPAEHGTVLALHHPPLDTHVPFLEFLDLRNRDALADLLHGTDVRAVLAGHWHLSATGWVAGVPVYVAGATSYSTDPAAPAGSFVGVDAGQGYRVVELSPEGVMSTVVPLRARPVATQVSQQDLAGAAALPPGERDATWCRFPVTDLLPD